MKRLLKLSLSIVLALNLQTAFTQEYTHGLGGQINFGIYNSVYTNNEYNLNYSGAQLNYVPGIVYKANLAFEISRDLTFSVASYPFLGFEYNTLTGGYFGFELPVLGELYFGDFEELGGFVGAGFSYSSMSIEGYGSGRILGPQLDAGFQFPFRDRIVELKCAYTIGLNKELQKDPSLTVTKDSRSLFSVGLVYMIGY